MGMKPCKECKKEVSTAAKVCPNCGKKHPTGGLTLPAKIFLGIIGLGVLGNMVGSNNSSTKNNNNAAGPIVVQSQKEKAIKNITIKWNWHKGGFDSIMIADFTITNPTEYSVKDIKLTCNHYAKSGTKIDSNTRIIYDIVPAKGKKTFKDFNMGMIHSQTDRSSVVIEDLEIAN